MSPVARSEPLEIVVVDDDVHAAQGMKRLLEDAGHSCRVANDGSSALDLLTRGPADVVISDSHMPGMDGLSLCRAIRARDAAYVYFILVTGDGDKSHLVAAMRSGADDYLTKPIDPDMLTARLVCAERIVRLHRTLRAKNRQLRRDSERNFQVARVDPLTGARNRRALSEDLHALYDEVRRYRSSCALAMYDLDHFKAYNDALGHLAGDEALRRLVHTVERELRAGDAIYRFGGEEFVVLLPHQDLARARLAMERIRRAVALSAPRAQEALTISIGVSELRADDRDEEDAIRRADAALYRAKVSGRNRIEL